MPTDNQNILITASSQQLDDDLVNIKGIAYSGGEISQYWSKYPIYIDIGRASIRAQVPLLVDHINSPRYRIGVVDVTKTKERIELSGKIDKDTEFGGMIVNAGRKIPWQLSVGMQTKNLVLLQEGSETEINGRTIKGPAYISSEADLYEVSIVAVGADRDTSLTILASLSNQPQNPNQGEPTMGESNNTPPAAPNTTTTQQPQAAPPAPATPPVTASANAPQAAPPAPATPSADDIRNEAIARERNRISAIRSICARHPHLVDRAIEENWDENTTRRHVLDEINAGYAVAVPYINTGGNAPSLEKQLLAAALQAVQVSEKDIVATVGNEALTEANQRWRGRIGLQELIIEAANANGARFTGHRLAADNWHEVTMHAAYRDIRAGFSAVNLPGILGSVIQRRLLDGAETVEQSWKEVAEEVSTKDFRKFETYRLKLDANGNFDIVPATGELKHGKLSEDSFSNQVDTYGMLLGLTRKDIINDDLGALSRIPFLLSQTAMMKFNIIFWTEFMDNASFFTSSNGNLLTGAANALSVEGLDAALAKFRLLKDGENIVGGTPRKLVVGPSNEALAGKLYTDTQVIATGVGSSAKTVPSGNQHVGKYKPVVSAYLEDTGITGYSTTAYYLLADPRFRSVIQVAFLDGKNVPTIETSEMEFSTLGLQFRCYFDFGTSKQDPKGGVKVTGAAAS